jgi:competence protein ComEA
MNDPRLRNALLLLSLAVLGGIGIGFAIAHRPADAPIVITGSPGTAMPTPPDPTTGAQTAPVQSTLGVPVKQPPPVYAPPLTTSPVDAPQQAPQQQAQPASEFPAPPPPAATFPAAQPAPPVEDTPPPDQTPQNPPAPPSQSAEPRSSESHESDRSAKLKTPGEGVVNLNTSSADDLERLPGVGPALAQRIIDYRTQSGPFQAPEDLMQVRGIGQKKFAKVQPFVVVR